MASVSLVLHAHLPFVRHPEFPSFLEEDWFFEALTETYIPLLRMMDRLVQDRVPFSFAMSLTPPLCEMLDDSLLLSRYVRRLDALMLIAVAEADVRVGTPFAEAARFYVDELREVRELFSSRWGTRLLPRFAAHQDAGRLEILTCGATHGFLPLCATNEARNAQIAVAVDNHRRHFGRSPRAIWLPECAFVPGVDALVAAHGIQWFCLERHGVADANPPPAEGTLRPIRTPSGAVAFGRDAACSQQVWSAEVGYPSDPTYREFYRDLGWELPEEVVRPLLDGMGNRKNIGLKLHRITGRPGLDDKEPWSPTRAKARAEDHAVDFLLRRQAQVEDAERQGIDDPHVLAPFDAELFGHWWFEGPWFLEALFRHAAQQSLVRLEAPGRYLARHGVAALREAAPALSSWGAGGFFRVWLNPSNDWIYRHLHHAEARMVELCRRFPRATGPLRAVLAQAARELLLAQASDWAFIMSMGTTVPYAHKRTRDHVARFTRIYEGLLAGDLDPAWLEEVSSRDNIFPEIDPYHFSTERLGPWADQLVSGVASTA